tara:strand:- start:4446 stop:4673 length:228 start_codon:yes stop_codon:yes gene_type:complete
MENSNTSFTTAISNSDESITGIIDETLDEYKYNFDIREYMNYPEIRKLLINNPIEMSLLEVTCILINNTVNDKKR